MSENVAIALELCPHCQKEAHSDIIVRCHLCRVAHHLECYARHNGCGVFNCLGPLPKEDLLGDQDDEVLAEEVFRAELADAVHYWNWRNESHFALLFMVISLLFFLLIFIIA